MAAIDRLVGLLAPLGIYSFDKGSYSFGELLALGTGVDGAAEDLAAMEPDCCLATATEGALERYELILFGQAGRGDLESRRRAIAALLNIGPQSFTLDEINRAVQGCGVNALVTETGPGKVRVSFPGLMGQPERLPLVRLIIENLLPAHLDIEIFFKYLTWQEASHFTWQEATQNTWDYLRHIDLGA